MSIHILKICSGYTFQIWIPSNPYLKHGNLGGRSAAIAAQRESEYEYIKPWQADDAPIAAKLKAQTDLLSKHFLEISQRGLPGECDYCRSDKTPVIEVTAKVVDDRAVLEITNHGGSASFTATGRIVEGTSRDEPYPMCWDRATDSRCQIDQGQTAKILVAEVGSKALESKNVVRTFQDGGLKSVFRDGLALYQWEPSGRGVFGAFTTVAETSGDGKVRTHMEDRCILEITLTASPPLVTPFRHAYSLSIESNSLVITDSPITGHSVPVTHTREIDSQVSRRYIAAKNPSDWDSFSANSSSGLGSSL